MRSAPAERVGEILKVRSAPSELRDSLRGLTANSAEYQMH
jgi:hypothetical protein